MPVDAPSPAVFKRSKGYEVMLPPVLTSVPFPVIALVVAVVVAALFMRPPRKTVEETTLAPVPAPAPVLLRDAA